MITNRLIPFAPFVAINLFGLIFVREGNRLTPENIRHERIHTRQMIETLFIGFYIIYVAEWCARVLIYRGNAMRAYRNILFEREAYAHQAQPDYLAHRRPFAWLR